MAFNKKTTDITEIKTVNDLFCISCCHKHSFISVQFPHHKQTTLSAVKGLASLTNKATLSLASSVQNLACNDCLRH